MAPMEIMAITETPLNDFFSTFPDTIDKNTITNNPIIIIPIFFI